MTIAFQRCNTNPIYKYVLENVHTHYVFLYNQFDRVIKY